GAGHDAVGAERSWPQGRRKSTVDIVVGSDGETAPASYHRLIVSWLSWSGCWIAWLARDAAGEVPRVVCAIIVSQGALPNVWPSVQVTICPTRYKKTYTTKIL